MPPAVQSLSFASPPDGRPPDGRPKESNPRKGDPTGRVPALRYGQPAVLARGAVPSNSLCSLRSRRSNNAGKSELEARASCSALARLSLCAPRHTARGDPWLGPWLRSARESAGVATLRSIDPFPRWGKVGMGALGAFDRQDPIQLVAAPRQQTPALPRRGGSAGRSKTLKGMGVRACPRSPHGSVAPRLCTRSKKSPKEAGSASPGDKPK